MRRALILVVLALVSLVFAQNPLPDAPTPNKPADNPLAGAPPAPKVQPRPDQPAATPAPPEPTPEVKTVPPGSVPETDVNSRDQMFTLVKNVNQVFIPVTVKDPEGHLKDGLLARDFEVLENGVVQKMNYFTSDPFPISAAVVIDENINDLTLRKVHQTMPALLGAFSAYDKVAVYQYGDTVHKVADFQPADTKLANIIKGAQHRGTTGVPVTGGPMASGPTINGRPFDPSIPHVQTPRHESHVLNDAILRAALDLAKQDKTTRRVLFVISDGREDGSTARYGDVLKVLLTNNILVYAVGVDSAAISGYNKAQNTPAPHVTGIHTKAKVIPVPEFDWFGYGNILPKYASATGGQVFNSFSREAIETAYSKVTEMARFQYTIGYMAKTTPSSEYRSIEVRVDRPELRVFARDGYFPLPPGRP